MHEMRTIAINITVAWASVCVCLTVTRASCAKTAERIELQFPHGDWEGMGKVLHIAKYRDIA